MGLLSRIGLVIVVSLVALAANAEVRTFKFTGMVTVAQGNPFGVTANVGEFVSGTWRYDTTVPPFIVGQQASYRQDSGGILQAVIGNTTLSSAEHVVRIWNDDSTVFGGQLGPVDFYGADSGSGVSPILVDGLPTPIPDNGLHFLGIGGDNFADLNGSGRDTLLSSNSLLEFNPEIFNEFRQVLFVRESGSVLLEANIILTEEIVSPEEALDVLANLVMDIDLGVGISNSLESKINAALAALGDLNANNDAAALNSIYAFCNGVEAQRNKKITDQDADSLIAAANVAISLIDENAMFCN